MGTSASLHACLSALGLSGAHRSYSLRRRHLYGWQCIWPLLSGTSFPSLSLSLPSATPRCPVSSGEVPSSGSAADVSRPWLGLGSQRYTEHTSASNTSMHCAAVALLMSCSLRLRRISFVTRESTTDRLY